jgi:hypothetical protein
MVQRIGASYSSNSFHRRRLSKATFFQIGSGAIGLTVSLCLGAGVIYVRSAPTRAIAKAARVASAPTGATNPYGALFNPYGALMDPKFMSGAPPASLAQSAPLEAKLASLESKLDSLPELPAAENPEPEQVTAIPIPEAPEPPIRTVPKICEGAPVPPTRPTDLRPPATHVPFQVAARHLAAEQRNKASTPPATPTDNRSFFEKLFGGPGPQPSGPALAYATPDSGAAGNARSFPSDPSHGYDQWTAVYDVAAHTVYLPNGTKLEAHSGLGDRLDDPRHANERNRGATPPQVYELEARAQLFHGVQALRLKPVGNGSVFGRVGLLAHSYMLGPKGDSNGCVAFRNYTAFLQAFQNGQVKRLAVVARVE